MLQTVGKPSEITFAADDYGRLVDENQPELKVTQPEWQPEYKKLQPELQQELKDLLEQGVEQEPKELQQELQQESLYGKELGILFSMLNTVGNHNVNAHKCNISC